jgi:hypothetical protein
MRTRQYGEPLIEKLCFRNWLRVLERTWGGTQARPAQAKRTIKPASKTKPARTRPSVSRSPGSG